MALLLSLSADCDSRNQLLSKTTSPRRKCSEEVTAGRERSGQSYVEKKGSEGRERKMKGGGAMDGLGCG